MAFSGITVSAGDIHSLLPDKAHEAAVIREVSGGEHGSDQKVLRNCTIFFSNMYSVR